MLGLALVVLALGAVPFATAARQDATPAAGGGGTLIGAFDAGPGGCPECFNPLTATAGFTWLEKYYSKLALYDVNFSAIQGELAESWEVSEDGLTYTFHLRDGVTWHDGEPFTSADVKFTIELAKDPASASYIGAKFANVTAVDTPDDLTAVLTLSEANAGLLDAVTFLVMLPEHALSDIAPADLIESDWWRTSPIGTGPFMWSDYAPGEYVDLVAYDGYWRGRPQLDKIINRFYPEAGSAVIALRSGEIQFTYLTTDEAAANQDDASLSILSGPSQVVNYLGFNLQDPQFADVRVRQAFMYAIDRDIIIEQLFGGTATKVPCIFHNPRFLPAESNDYAADPDQARALLEEAGWNQTEPIEVITYYADQLSADILVTMQQMLGDVGIDMEIRAVDVPTFNQIMGTTDWQVIYAGAANGPDPDATSTYFISTATPPDGFNRTYVNLPELDELYLQGRAEVDPAARDAVYQQVCSVLNEQLPWAWMWVSDRFGGASTSIGNFIWTPAPGGGRYYDAAETWTIAQ
jgi:peptide/nickel transport system substrate-binding protein